MKNLSFTLTMVLCVLIMQAQMSNADQPEEDSLWLSETQTINLNQGWSGISSYLDPANPELALLMAAIEEQLIIIKDFDGNSYQPSTKNTLIEWDFKQGYFIKMGSQETFEIAGLFPLSKQLDLQTGWNLIPVLSDVPVDIEDYFYDHLDKVEIVTEVAGLQVFWPGLEIFTLDQVAPGKAYLVKTLAPFSLYQLPEVITAPITQIASTSATCGGEVIVEGSSSVTVRGLVWSASVSPTVGENEGITFDGEGTGTWVSELVELTPETTYFVRAYATNSAGTAYGDELSFTTLSETFSCSDTFIDSRDGRTYTTVQIGDQCWMQQNMNFETNDSWCYDNDPENCETFGRLYNHNAANQACPDGWHLPDNAEWCQLAIYLDETVNCADWGNLGTDAGGKMKSTGTLNTGGLWWEPNTGATNESGFSGIPGGFYHDGGFGDLSAAGRFWSATSSGTDWFFYWILGFDHAQIVKAEEHFALGFSVRCIMDSAGAITIPAVSTSDITNISDTSADSGGIVTNSGGAFVTARGVVWSAYANPTIDVNEGITFDGEGTGTWVSELFELTPETTYFVRAYATNSAGTAYGDELSFTTLSETFSCGDTFIDSRDGKTYATVQIGDQCWMQQNMNFETENSWCYANDPGNCETFGRLYNHNAAIQVCPDGWHLPNNDDWCQLAIYLDETVNCADWGNLGTDAGGKMKSTGTLNTGGLWWEPNTGATNESGFSGLPGGFYHDGGFGDLSAAGRFWSATSSGTDWFFYWNLGFDHAQIVKAEEHFALGFSVRCVRDN
jgi:uncharacterized protein (TIGR02145 family)